MRLWRILSGVLTKGIDVEAEIAMQIRCVHCKKEQWAMAVYKISHGEIPCVWCGKMSEPMTREAYWEALSKGGRE